MSELKVGDELEVIDNFYSADGTFCKKEVVVYEGIYNGGLYDSELYSFHSKENKNKITRFSPNRINIFLRKIESNVESKPETHSSEKKDMKYTIEQIKYLQKTYKNKNCHPDVKEFISKTLDNQRKLLRKEFFQGLKEDIDMFNRTTPHNSLIFPENEDYNIIKFMFKAGKYYIKLEEKHLLLEVVEIPYQQGLSMRFSTIEEINF